ncbi:hypothetical protein D3C78_1633030 [compost metagenome]
MGDPLVDLIFIVAQLTQLLEHTDVVQRMDVAADQRRHAAHLGPQYMFFGQQCRLWINLFQILDDRR